MENRVAIQRNTLITGLVLLTFFVISFITNILGTIIPAMISGFHIKVGLAGFLPFSFFVAYGVMSIPAGLLVERYKEKRMMVVAFAMVFAGALTFAIEPTFAFGLQSLFVMGCGMAILQVVINPLLRTAGGEANFAFNSVLAQLFFGLASFLSPQVYTYFVQRLRDDDSLSMGLNWLKKTVPPSLAWTSLYWVFACICLLMLAILIFIRIPKVNLREDEKVRLGKPLVLLMKSRQVWLFFLGIFAYVGTEQGVATWISTFLVHYHNVDAETLGATVNAYFWGMMTVGCLLGLVLLLFFDSKRVLVVFSIAAMIALAIALFGDRQAAVFAFPAMGFFLSVMYSIIFSLALNSVVDYHGTFSGILCSGIAGGALVPLLVGAIGDFLGLRIGLLFLYVTLGYILCIGLWAKPLISNLRKTNVHQQ